MIRPVCALPVLLSLALLCGGCASGREGAPSVPVRLLEEPAGVPRAGELLWRSSLHLRDGSSDFGGLSSLRVAPDGSQFVAISDRGRRISGRLSYDGGGRLAAASDFQIATLLGPDGQPFPGFYDDTEGLALLGDWPGDGWAVSMERRHSIWHYPPALAGVKATPVDGPAGLSDLAFNSGLETLLALSDGRLLAIAEGDEGQGLHRAWLGRSGDWIELRYRALPPFLPVDAARLPDGGLLVLERRVGLLGGWGSRIVHVPAADLPAMLVRDGVLAGREIARLAPPMTTENYEGIDTRALPGGGVAIYLVSDDNFNGLLQRTLLTMFEWQP